jgi:hypothetical protein
VSITLHDRMPKHDARQQISTHGGGLPSTPSGPPIGIAPDTERIALRGKRSETGWMSNALTAGQRLVRTLDESLTPNIEWTPSERAVLTLIEQAADRIETLKVLLDVEVARPEPAAHRCWELAGEIRQSENAVAKLIGSLDPMMTREPKSERHQRAAYARWSGAGISGPA